MCVVIVSFSSLKAEIDPKHYPRDPQRDQTHSGRVRVQLVNEEDVSCNELAQNSEWKSLVESLLLVYIHSFNLHGTHHYSGHFIGIEGTPKFGDVQLRNVSLYVVFSRTAALLVDC